MSSRNRFKGRRGPDERYALLPREVLESEAYAALPDFAVRVLIALAGQYMGKNNGELSMTAAQARGLGVSSAWKVPAGLRLCNKAGLIERTRKGKFRYGRGISALYALAWKQLDASPNAFPPIEVARPAANTWARWQRPADWKKTVKQVKEDAHGKSRPLSEISPTIPHAGTKAVPNVGSKKTSVRAPRRE